MLCVVTFNRTKKNVVVTITAENEAEGMTLSLMRNEDNMRLVLENPFEDELDFRDACK